MLLAVAVFVTLAVAALGVVVASLVADMWPTGDRLDRAMSVFIALIWCLLCLMPVVVWCEALS